MKELYLKLTSDINTKAIMSDFCSHYKRMIITNENSVTIDDCRYYYNIIISCKLPDEMCRGGVIVVTKDNSISLIDLRNEKLKTAYSFCNNVLTNIIKTRKKNFFYKNEYVWFKESLLIRFQTLTDEWGHFHIAGVVGVIITHVENINKKKDVMIIPQIKKRALDYQVLYEGKYYYISDADNIQQVIEIFNDIYKKKKKK